MHLGLGPTNIVLQDGFASWNASAVDAVAVWNGYLDFITFSSVSESTVPQASGDGINAAFFSDNIFGDTFDESTIAVTVIETTDDPKVTGEADVVMNTAFRYDSYRGPQQSDARGDVIDFHRVMLHELGHVLGLDHIDLVPPGQVLMEPYISDVDHPSLDDVAGVRFRYGAHFDFLPGPEYTVREGDIFSFPDLVANNSPTSFSAIDLPPGITMNTTTGALSGNVTTPGEYRTVITAHGPIADTYGSFSVSVVGLNQLPGLVSIIRGVNGSYFLGDPARPYIYVATDDGIARLNTDTETLELLSPGHTLPDVLSLSADGSLLYFRQQVQPTLHRLDLNTLTELPVLTIPVGYSPVLEGIDGRGYTDTLDGIAQFDLATGAVQSVFGPSPYPQIEITPDGHTLIVVKGEESISSYDISTESPSLVATQNGLFTLPQPSSDSAHVYVASSANGTMTEFPLPGLGSGRSFGMAGSPFVTAGPDGSIYQAFTRYPHSVSVYDPATLQVAGQLEISDPPFSGWDIGRVVFDSDPDHFFLVAYAYGQTELWKFSTHFSSFPPADPIPTQYLTNLSTRVRTGTGDDVMIGGFIVQGDAPKEVVVRGLGPTLPLSGAITDPVLDLYDAAGRLVATNDSWTTNSIPIIASQLSPSSVREAAIRTTLDPGAYTAIVHDAKGQAGAALVEIYDLAASYSLLANISTRGKVGIGDDVLIGGFIVGGVDPTEVLIRAIGPSLTGKGVAGALEDPFLELHDYDGTIIATNDNWRSTQEAAITATGLAPEDDHESAILATLDGYRSYTAIVRGQGATTGTALVEVYNLSHPNESRK
jgi:hypothetical protein